MHTAEPGDVEAKVRTALGAEQLGPRDQGVVALVLAYARHLDGEVRCAECGGPSGADITKAGPALLAALESLLLSPRARAAAKKAVTNDQPAANPLDQLATRRAGRGRPQAVDAAAP